MGALRFFLACLISILVSNGVSPSRAHADPMREFIMSCTYGVLAGTLVGAASLAFTDQPGDNLNRVARGASLGLYSGILLGFYVIYLVPDPSQQDPNLYEMPGYPIPEGGRGSLAPPRLSLPVAVFPLLNENGIDGVAAQVQVHSF